MTLIVFMQHRLKNTPQHYLKLSFLQGHGVLKTWKTCFEEMVMSPDDSPGMGPANNEDQHGSQADDLLVVNGLLGAIRRDTQAIDERIAGYDECLDKYYAEALAQTTEPEAITISLDTIPEGQRDALTQALKAKLQEYDRRLRDEILENPYRAPETLDSHERYKRACLRLLLKDGMVNTMALSRTFGKLEGGVDDLFNSACAVIHDYVLTGGRRVSGGTGLIGIQ